MKTFMTISNFQESRLIYNHPEAPRPSQAEKAADKPKTAESKDTGAKEAIVKAIDAYANVLKDAKGKVAETKKMDMNITNKFNPKELVLSNGTKYKIINNVKDSRPDSYELVADKRPNGTIEFDNGACGDQYQPGILGVRNNGDLIVYESTKRNANPFILKVDPENHTLTISKPELGYNGDKKMEVSKGELWDELILPNGEKYEIKNETQQKIDTQVYGKYVDFDHGSCGDNYGPGKVEFKNGKIYAETADEYNRNPMTVIIKDHTITIRPPKYGYDGKGLEKRK